MANETTEFWRGVREESQQKREGNRLSSAELLMEACIAFEVKNGGAHLVIPTSQGRINFWPGTGKWMKLNGSYERGVKALIEYVRSLDTAK